MFLLVLGKYSNSYGHTALESLTFSSGSNQTFVQTAPAKSTETLKATEIDDEDIDDLIAPEVLYNFPAFKVRSYGIAGKRDISSMASSKAISCTSTPKYIINRVIRT